MRLIAEITNFTKELQDFTAKMVDSIRKAGDTVNHPSRMTQIQRSLFQTFRSWKRRKEALRSTPLSECLELAKYNLKGYTCTYCGPIYLQPEQISLYFFNFQFQTDVLLPTKNEVHIIFGKGGLFNRYDKYR